MLTHVVLMKFRDAADAAQGKRLLEGLAERIEEIRGLTVGLDVTRAEVSYDLCLTTLHATADELRGYQEDPAHLEVAGWLRPRLTARATVDYED